MGYHEYHCRIKFVLKTCMITGFYYFFYKSFLNPASLIVFISICPLFNLAVWFNNSSLSLGLISLHCHCEAVFSL